MTNIIKYKILQNINLYTLYNLLLLSLNIHTVNLKNTFFLNIAFEFLLKFNIIVISRGGAGNHWK